MALLGTWEPWNIVSGRDARLPGLASPPAICEKRNYKHRISNPSGYAKLVANTRTSGGPKLGIDGAWSGPGGVGRSRVSRPDPPVRLPLGAIA